MPTNPLQTREKLREKEAEIRSTAPAPESQQRQPQGFASVRNLFKRVSGPDPEAAEEAKAFEGDQAFDGVA